MIERLKQTIAAAKLPPRTSSIASFEPKCEACKTHDGCEEHGLFTCPTCNRTVRWRDGGDPELDCSDCWYDARALAPVPPARFAIGAAPGGAA